jgi:hypothetical protein
MLPAGGGGSMLALVMLLCVGGGPVTADDLVYPGSRLLVRQTVSGRELEIHWSCRASRDAPDAVVAHYAKDTRLAPGGWLKQEGEHGFESKANAQLHVAVFPAKALAQHSPCSAPLEDGELTVVQVSLGVRRSPRREN